MKHSKQVEILKELMSQLDENRNVDAGAQYRLPTSDYICPDLAQREWNAFFREHPQIIGLSGDLPENSSFFTIDDFGAPVLATRGKDGVFRAFLNACRHRGARVAQEPKGKAARFTCPFHSWTFANDGKLLAIPEQDHFGPVDKSCMGLVELPAAEVAGMLFVHPQPAATLDVEALLGEELLEELEGWGFKDYIHVADLDIDKKLNWKLANDTFGETYHFPKLHKNTLGHVFYGNNLAYEEFGRHHRFVTASKLIDALRGLPEDQWTITPATFVLYYLFPNIQAVCVSTGMNMARIYPDPNNPGRSLTRVAGYFSPQALAIYEEQVANGGSEGKLLKIEEFYARAAEPDIIRTPETAVEAFSSTVSAEDYVMGEHQQFAASSGQLEYSLFGRNEAPLHHFHSNYRDALGRPPLEKIG
ncbi:aromatic ring-hydroxylating oxygenase subunit alpha [Altererythrobacter sp. MF3-039]|uniref:aromatic ring-hydroxylating oxygenase subunit alpha n=1 Tax=Altererythrobacter sp. MF3-039 TaxID=3252901 RepID=UPI00390CA60C